MGFLATARNDKQFEVDGWKKRRFAEDSAYRLISIESPLLPSYDPKNIVIPNEVRDLIQQVMNLQNVYKWRAIIV